MVGSSRNSSSGSPTIPSADVEPASLAAGQRPGSLAALLAQPDRLDHLVRVARGRVEAGEVPDQLGDGQLAGLAGRLQDDADPRPPGSARLGRVVTEHRDLAGVAAAEALEDLHGGGLAGPVGTEQREDLARLDVQVDPVDGGATGVPLHQPAHLHDGIASWCLHPPTFPRPDRGCEDRAS